MRVELMTTVKGMEGDVSVTWEKGTIFNSEVSVPKDIMAEVERKSGNVKILGDLPRETTSQPEPEIIVVDTLKSMEFDNKRDIQRAKVKELVAYLVSKGHKVDGLKREGLVNKAIEVFDDQERADRDSHKGD